MGGAQQQQNDKYSKLLSNIIRYTALLIPIGGVIFSIFVAAGITPGSTLFSVEAAIAINLAIMIVAVWQFMVKEETRNFLFISLVLYYIVGIAYTIFITGFLNLITLYWVVLLVVSDLNFSAKGAAYGAGALFATMLFSTAVEPNISVAVFVQHLMYVTVIVGAAVFVNRLRWVENVEHSDFEKTKEKQSVQQSQLMTLINSVNEAIINTNALGVVQIYNAATLNLLDTNESLAGKRLNDILHLYDEKGEPVQLFDLLKKEGKSIQREDLEHRFGDGEVIKLGISSSVVRSNRGLDRNKIEGYILVVRDITKSKSLEEERDEFISVVSHELRTPITIAEGTLSNLQLLMERGGNQKMLGASLQDAHEQIIYLAKMVNDLSTLSRAERGVADAPEEIDVTEMMHDLYSQYETKAQNKGLHLNLDTMGKLGSVMASRLYLEEVLQNFITNAIKYTEKGSITLSAHRKGSQIEFAVKDTGIGISKSDQKRVFEKFYRSEDYRTRETSGTGLGLYVVQKLSHKLGVSIQLSSRLNHGSTFSFTMDALQAPIDGASDKR